MYPRLVLSLVLVQKSLCWSNDLCSFPACLWVSSVARSCATKGANNKDYVCKPTIPAGIKFPPPSKINSPITWFGTISTDLFDGIQLVVGTYIKLFLVCIPRLGSPILHFSLVVIRWVRSRMPPSVYFVQRVQTR